jgi:hypothetical protein
VEVGNDPHHNLGPTTTVERGPMPLVRERSILPYKLSPHLQPAHNLTDLSSSTPKGCSTTACRASTKPSRHATRPQRPRSGSGPNATSAARKCYPSWRDTTARTRTTARLCASCMDSPLQSLRMRCSWEQLSRRLVRGASEGRRTRLGVQWTLRRLFCLMTYC